MSSTAPRHTPCTTTLASRSPFAPRYIHRVRACLSLPNRSRLVYRILEFVPALEASMAPMAVSPVREALRQRSGFVATATLIATTRAGHTAIPYVHCPPMCQEVTHITLSLAIRRALCILRTAKSTIHRLSKLRRHIPILLACHIVIARGTSPLFGTQIVPARAPIIRTVVDANIGPIRALVRARTVVPVLRASTTC